MSNLVSSLSKSPLLIFTADIALSRSPRKGEDSQVIECEVEIIGNEGNLGSSRENFNPSRGLGYRYAGTDRQPLTIQSDRLACEVPECHVDAGVERLFQVVDRA
jgi:hypothetical protein